MGRVVVFYLGGSAGFQGWKMDLPKLGRGIDMGGAETWSGKREVRFI